MIDETVRLLLASRLGPWNLDEVELVSENARACTNVLVPWALKALATYFHIAIYHLLAEISGLAAPVHGTLVIHSLIGALDLTRVQVGAMHRRATDTLELILRRRTNTIGSPSSFER